MRHELASPLEQCGEIASKLSSIPLVFLGVGLYRAWLSLFFRYDLLPNITVSDYFTFETTIGFSSLILALLARRLCPLWKNQTIIWLSFVCMTLGSCIIIIGSLMGYIGVIKYLGLMLAGLGLAILILMWAEFYGSINPMKVALYHSMGIMFGEGFKWLFMGMNSNYLYFFAIVLPAICIFTIKISMSRISHTAPNCDTQAFDKGTIPWKPIILMAVCSLAAAFEALPTISLSWGNTAGAFLACAVVIFGVFSQTRWFNFDIVYQLAFPTFIIALLLVLPPFAGNTILGTMSYESGYTMLTIFIVVVFGNITYRYNVNAVWVCGIERGIRYFAELGGWSASLGLSHVNWLSNSAASVTIVIAAALIFAMIFFSERSLSAKWGIEFTDKQNLEFTDRQWMSLRIAELSRQYHLTPREDEVLRHLIEGKTTSQIESELYLAQGTIKAHISHIYKKFGIHSRSELHALFNRMKRS